MNRIQFFVLTGISSLFVILLIGQVFLARQTGYQQAVFNQAEQVVTQGNASKQMVEQLAKVIYTESSKDPANQNLKQIMQHQGITFKPNASTNSAETPVPPTSSTSTPVR